MEKVIQKQENTTLMRVTKDVHQDVKVYAVKNKLTMSEAIKKLLAEQED